MPHLRSQKMESCKLITKTPPIGVRSTRLSRKQTPGKINKTNIGNSSSQDSPITPGNVNVVQVSPIISPYSQSTPNTRSTPNARHPSQDGTMDILWNWTSPLRKPINGKENTVTDLFKSWNENDDAICPSQPLLNKWLSSRKAENLNGDNSQKPAHTRLKTKRKKDFAELNNLLEILKKKTKIADNVLQECNLKERKEKFSDASSEEEGLALNGTRMEDILAHASLSISEEDWGNDDCISQLSQSFLSQLEASVIPSTLTCERDNNTISEKVAVESELLQEEFVVSSTIPKTAGLSDAPSAPKRLLRSGVERSVKTETIPPSKNSSVSSKKITNKQNNAQNEITSCEIAPIVNKLMECVKKPKSKEATNKVTDSTAKELTVLACSDAPKVTSNTVTIKSNRESESVACKRTTRLDSGIASQTISSHDKKINLDESLWDFDEDIDDSSLLSQEILQLVDHGTGANVFSGEKLSESQQQRCSTEQIAKKREDALRRRKIKSSFA